MTHDWSATTEHLDSHGWARLPQALDAPECRALADLYDRDDGEEGTFRSHILMARHGFGRGEYKYFSYPLPTLIESLRTSLYPHLAPLANQWYTNMGLDVQFPDTHAEFVA